MRPGGYSTPGAINPFAPEAPNPLMQLLSAISGGGAEKLPMLPAGTNQSVSSAMQPTDTSRGPIAEGAGNPYAGRGGLASILLGADNPVSKWTGDNRNFLRGVGAALLSGGPRLDFSNVPAYAALDDDRRVKAQEWTAGESSKQHLVLALKNYGYSDLADALAAGNLDAKTATEEMFSRKATDAKQAKADAANKANAAFLKTPELRAAVENGAMSFADAIKLEREGGTDLKDQFGFEKDLFQQYANSDPVKTYEAVKGGYERVRESASQQSGAGDMGLIYGLMRMYDPGSVVRESEFAMAAQAGSFGEQVQGLVTKLMNGERLPDSVRKQFIAEAEKLYGSAAENLSDINGQFADRAKGYSVDPGRFIRQPEQYAPWGQPQPISSQAEYQALPSGTQYMAPDGTVRTKP